MLKSILPLFVAEAIIQDQLQNFEYLLSMLKYTSFVICETDLVLCLFSMQLSRLKLTACHM